MRYFVFLFFIICIIGITGIKAVSYSPSSLIFNLNMEEEQCKMITIDSESQKITLTDRWAENKDVKWDVNQFKNDSNFHSITLNYPKTLENQKEAEVCIKGEKPGEYHGVLLLKEEQNGNSVIQAGIWVKAMINDKVQDKQTRGFLAITGNSIGNITKKLNIYYLAGILVAVLVAGAIVVRLNKKKMEDPFKC